MERGGPVERGEGPVKEGEGGPGDGGQLWRAWGRREKKNSPKNESRKYWAKNRMSRWILSLLSR